jgi:tetratricopeptide (TPR) repeat protein
MLLLVLLVFIAVAWLALDPAGSVTALRRFDGPLYNVWPPVMPGGFNIAVAGFALEGEAMDDPDLAACGWEIGEWLAQGIRDEKIHHPDIVATVWGPEEVGIIAGDTPADRKSGAAKFAGTSQADIVIHGVITGSADNYFVKPEFYVLGDGFDYGSEVAGPDQLGRPVPLSPPCGDLEKNELNNDLKGRRRVLHHVAYGLAHFYYNDYVSAYQEFDDASNETAGKELEAVHLFKGAAKMREYGDTELSREERMQALAEAEVAIDEAFNLNPAYPRSHLGLGGIAFQQATVLNPEWPQSVDQAKLREAEAHYLESLTLVDQPDLAYVYIKGNYGLGQIYLTGYHYFLCDWSGKQAQTYFNNVINAYPEPSPGIFWFVGKARASLAWLAMLDGDPQRAAVAQSRCPQFMAFDHNQWSTIVLTECQQAIALLEQIEFNRPEDTIADCRSWMESAAAASP